MTTEAHSLCNISFIAKLLDVSEATVRRMAKTGRIPSHRVGGQFRFDPDEVLKATKYSPGENGESSGG